jgi:hypothetical protein
MDACDGMDYINSAMRIPACCILLLLVPVASWSQEISVPAPIVEQRVSSTAGHIWRHPAEAYPPSLNRWFRSLPPPLQYSEVRFQTGDDVRWAQPEWDDRDWQTIGFWDLPARAGIHWIRFRVRMGNNAEGRLPSGVMMSTVVAYEVFWDGVLIGNSGVPGMDRETEVPGRVDQWFSVPAALLGPGEHVIAIRSSSYLCGFPSAKSGFRFLVDSPAILQGKAVREAIVPTIAAGALFMVGMASFIMWLLAARRGALLILCAMCASIAAMQALHSIRWFFQYPADWHFPALFAMTWLVALQALCMIALVMAHFELPGRRWILGAMVPLFGLVSWISPQRVNLEGVNILIVGFTSSLACVIWAAWHKRRDAWPAVGGISVSLILLLIEKEDFRTNFFLKFLPAMVGLMASLALHLHAERRRAQAAQLAAARLELEMLKKNIQPHFLLNTLATIMETIEQEPKTAAALVEALASEFRILSRVAGEKLVPLTQEVDLCQAHLRVMSRRKCVTCSLVVKADDDRLRVPPAVFHTLVENGLTHLLPRHGRIDFSLRAERSAMGVRYTLIALGERQPSSGNAAAGTLSESPRRTEGTGLRYIKARLEESFTGMWTLHSGPVTEGWKTVIDIADTNSLSGARPRSSPIVSATPASDAV